MTDVTIVDSAPRDGLGALCKLYSGISTSDKVTLINLLVQSGLTKIDSVAFIHPRLRPEYSDAEKTMKAVGEIPGVTFIGIAPNEIACRRALSTNVNQIAALVAATDTFNKAVLGKSIKETLNKTFPSIFQAGLERGKSIRVYVLSAFSCFYEGNVSLSNIVDLTRKLAFMGAKEISLVDSAGSANPKQVKEYFSALQALNLEVSLAAHFHNCRGLALVNCLAAYETGIRTFDTAIGGLSGTPFGAPQMEIGSWNVPTEDLASLFEEMGIKTGIDLDALLAAVEFAEKLARRKLPGHILSAKNALRFGSLPESLKIE